MRQNADGRASGRRRLASAFALVTVIGAAGGAQAAPALEPLDHAVCRLIENAAQADNLPVGFMTRVIWRESSFRPAAVSPAGAEGIAQFMPATAGERDLPDPFDPQQAIPQAARLLAALRSRFGNLGLAAAAYNAGAARVAGWLRGAAELPPETQAYVRFVTLRDAATWLPAGAPPDDSTAALSQGCPATIAALRSDTGAPGIDTAFAPLAPWGVQLAGNFSKPLALAEFARAERRDAAVIGGLQPMVIGRRLRYLGTRMFYQVRLPAPTRSAANLLCERIRAAGGACVALRS